MVTGASSGMGKEIALALKREGQSDRIVEALARRGSRNATVAGQRGAHTFRRIRRPIEELSSNWCAAILAP
ncbi:MAG TPA: hypothetical protein DEV93_13965 [Chloroflexi bacterium]|nr:hypothetical protein [Chloroflexota bacterium]